MKDVFLVLYFMKFLDYVIIFENRFVFYCVYECVFLVKLFIIKDEQRLNIVKKNIINVRVMEKKININIKFCF